MIWPRLVRGMAIDVLIVCGDGSAKLPASSVHVDFAVREGGDEIKAGPSRSLFSRSPSLNPSDVAFRPSAYIPLFAIWRPRAINVSGQYFVFLVRVLSLRRSKVPISPLYSARSAFSNLLARRFEMAGHANLSPSVGFARPFPDQG